MPYISELLNNRVTDSSDVTAGKLRDILISPKEGALPPWSFWWLRTFKAKSVLCLTSLWQILTAAGFP